MRKIKAAEIRTGDQLVMSDGRMKVVTQVCRDGEAVKLYMSGTTTVWAPASALMTVKRQSRVIDLDQRKPVHTSESKDDLWHRLLQQSGG